MCFSVYIIKKNVTNNYFNYSLVIQIAGIIAVVAATQTLL